MRVKNFQLVELIIGASITGLNASVYFQQQPQLQSFNLPNQRVFIKAIETYSSNAVFQSPITPTNPVASPFDISNAVLTIVEQTSENKKQVPLAALNRVWPSAGGNIPPALDLFQFKNLFTVDWSKSYVTVLSTAPTRPFSYLFGVYYDYEPDLEDVTLSIALQQDEIARLQLLQQQRIAQGM